MSFDNAIAPATDDDTNQSEEDANKEQSRIISTNFGPAVRRSTRDAVVAQTSFQQQHELSQKSNSHRLRARGSASKRKPCRGWVRVKREPSPNAGFEVLLWIPRSELTPKEEEELEAKRAAALETECKQRQEEIMEEEKSQANIISVSKDVVETEEMEPPNEVAQGEEKLPEVDGDTVPMVGPGETLVEQPENNIKPFSVDVGETVDPEAPYEAVTQGDQTQPKVYSAEGVAARMVGPEGTNVEQLQDRTQLVAEKEKESKIESLKKSMDTDNINEKVSSEAAGKNVDVPVDTSASEEDLRKIAQNMNSSTSVDQADPSNVPVLVESTLVDPNGDSSELDAIEVNSKRDACNNVDVGALEGTEAIVATQNSGDRLKESRTVETSSLLAVHADSRVDVSMKETSMPISHNEVVLPKSETQSIADPEASETTLIESTLKPLEPSQEPESDEKAQPMEVASVLIGEGHAQQDPTEAPTQLQSPATDNQRDAPLSAPEDYGSSPRNKRAKIGGNGESDSASPGDASHNT